MKKLLFFIVASLFFSCATRSSQGEVEVVDMTGLKEEPIRELGNFRPESRVVLQEGDTKDRMLGNVDKVMIRGDKFFVSDNMTKKLLVFDKDGNVTGKVGALGRGPGEYADISDFDMDREGNIYVFDANSSRMLMYDSTYQYKSTIEVPFYIDYFRCLGDGGFLFALASINRDKYPDDMLLSTDAEFKAREHIVRYDKTVVDDEFWMSDFALTRHGSEIFFNRPIDDNVYVMDGERGSLLKTYRFDFGADMVPVKYRKDIESVLESMMPNYRCLVNFTIVSGKYIYGSMYDRGVYKNFILDRVDNTIYTTPVWENEDVEYGHFCTVDGNRLITVAEPGAEEGSYVISLFSL